jgi:flagellar hook-basal body complex protein FliE
MDPISAMRLAGAGGIQNLSGNLAGVQAPKISTQELPGVGNIGPAETDGIQPGRSFSDFLGEMVRDVNAKQADASATVNGALAGENVPLHQAMLSVEEASVSFQLMVEVRNKLLDSYQELMRMQI